MSRYNVTDVGNIIIYVVSTKARVSLLCIIIYKIYQTMTPAYGLVLTAASKSVKCNTVSNVISAKLFLWRFKYLRIVS